ncbi:hypothetical protein AMTRI_Chr10g6050 [Amborella trichopoda]
MVAGKMKTGDGERKVGGLKTMPFILANEVCDRFATAGLMSNMISYLTQQLHMPLVKASNTLTNFAGTASLTPLIGALISDSFAGGFWTITVASVIYQLGMILLTLSAVLPGLHPPPCPMGGAQQQETCPEASTKQLWILYLSLLLTSLGSGGIRPCVVPFGANQFDVAVGHKAARNRSFFNWFYFCMGCASLAALTIAVYIQENVGGGWGFGVPTIAMAISVVVFVLGYRLYRHFEPAGSPLTRLAQVIVAAQRKRKMDRPEDAADLYENKELDASISTTGKLLHTNHLKFFDKAAVITESDKPVSDPPNLWRLCTVHRVEELKSVIRILPIWAAGILLTTASSHQNSFSIQQARSMDRRLSPSSFKIPPASMSIFSNLAMLLTLVVYDRLLTPVLRKHNITYMHRMGVGLLISIGSTAAAAIVEVQRRAVAARHGLLDSPHATVPISVFWLVPQHALHGMAEAFVVVGHLEFMYDQAPESMRSIMTALFWTAIAAGNYLSTFLVSMVHKFSGDRNWIPDRNLNRGRLDCYYWLVTGIQVLNLGYYVVCARYYTFKPIEPVVADKGLADLELEQQGELSNVEKGQPYV